MDLPGPVAELDVPQPGMRTGAGSILGSGNSRDEIISTAILSLLLIQVGQLLVLAKVVHLVLVNRVGSLPRNSVIKLSDRLDMTIVVDWDVKLQIKQTNKSGFSSPVGIE